MERVGIRAPAPGTRVRAPAFAAVDDVVPHPAVVSILVRLATGLVGHDVHVIVPLILREARVVKFFQESLALGMHRALGAHSASVRLNQLPNDRQADAGMAKYIPTFNKIRLSPYPSISASESIST